MRRIQDLILKIIVKNKGRGRENILKASVLLLSVCMSTIIFVERKRFENLGVYGYAGVFVSSLVGSATVVVPSSTFLTAIIAGGILNPLTVAIVAALGSSFGELTGYVAGVGGKVLAINSSIYKKVDGWMQRRGFLTLFILSGTPNPFFDIAGISAGFTNYPLSKFLLATFLGKCVKFLFLAFLGFAAGNFLY